MDEKVHGDRTTAPIQNSNPHALMKQALEMHRQVKKTFSYENPSIKSEEMTASLDTQILTKQNKMYESAGNRAKLNSTTIV